MSFCLFSMTSAQANFQQRVNTTLLPKDVNHGFDWLSYIIFISKPYESNLDFFSF